MGSIEQTKTVAEAAEFLRAARLRRGWTAQQLAQKIEEVAKMANDDLQITQQAISYFETGKTKTVPRWLRHVNLAFMIDDVDQRSVSAFAQQFEGKADNDDSVDIEMLDLAFGMGGAFLDSDHVEVETKKFPLSWLRRYSNSPPSLLKFARGIGDSMAPTILDQDEVLVDCGRTSFKGETGDRIWACVFGGIGMIKRLRQLGDGTVRIMSDNPLVSDELATDGDLFLIGRVVYKGGGL